MLDASATQSAATEMPGQQNRIRLKRGLDPLVQRGVNGNTVVGRRIRRAWNQYLAAMGNPVAALSLANAADAAELRIAVEDMQARLRAGEAVSEDLVRLRNAFERAERKLGLKPGAPKPGPTLAELLASPEFRATLPPPSGAAGDDDPEEPSGAPEKPAHTPDDPGAA
jgi:hypothetical protein